MSRFEVQHRYSSWRDGQRFGPWTKGDVIELSDDDAAWVNRDSEGALAPVESPSIPVEDVPAPAEEPERPNRQHKSARTRGPA